MVVAGSQSMAAINLPLPAIDHLMQEMLVEASVDSIEVSFDIHICLLKRCRCPKQGRSACICGASFNSLQNLVLQEHHV